jgi:O-antigen ligase
VRTIAAIGALLLLPISWRKPRYGMIVLIGLQVLFLGGSLELDAEKFVYGAFFGILMLAWAPAFLHTKRTWIRHPISKWLLAILGLMLISRVVGATHGISTVDWFRDLSSMLNYSWILLGIYAFGPTVEIKKYAMFLLMSIAILTVPITLQWMYYRSTFDSEKAVLDNMTLGPGINLFGTFLAAAFLLDAKDTSSKRKFLLLTAGFVVAAFLTGTRGVLASLAAGSFAYFLLLRHEGKVSLRRVLSTLSVPVLLALLVTFVLTASRAIDMGALMGRYTEALTSEMLEDDTVQDRVMEVLDGWNAFRQNPVLGEGLGYRTESVYHIGGIEFQPNMLFMHNFYVYLLAKLGIIGFVVFIGFLASITRCAAREYFRRPASFEKYFFGSMVALMVALVMQSITASQFNDRLATGLLGIMVGMMIAMGVTTGQSTALVALRSRTA